MEGTAAAEAGGAVGDAQIKPLQPQPSGREALEMPATPLPLARELAWSEHFSFFSSAGGTTDGARGVGLSSSVSRPADSVTEQQRRCLDSRADERVEELMVRNCSSNSDAQRDAPAAGSKKPEQ